MTSSSTNSSSTSSSKPQKTGLILEGGALRGLFTAGVLDVFMENGVAFDAVIGVSAGAAFGCNIKSKQIGRVLRYNLKLCGDPRYWSWRSFFRTGDLFDGDFCYREIPESFDRMDYDTYNENPLPFYMVATDCDTGRPVYHLGGDLESDLPWMQASASMPMMANMVEIDGHRYLDGGCSDSIPLDYFTSIGYGHSVLILTRPREAILKPNNWMPLIRRRYKAFPALVHALETRHLTYNATCAKIRLREAEGSLCVIRPEAPLPIGELTHDRTKIQTTYAIGRRVGKQRLADVKRFIAG